MSEDKDIFKRLRGNSIQGEECLQQKGGTEAEVPIYSPYLSHTHTGRVDFSGTDSGVVVLPDESDENELQLLTIANLGEPSNSVCKSPATLCIIITPQLTCD